MSRINNFHNFLTIKLINEQFKQTKLNNFKLRHRIPPTRIMTIQIFASYTGTFDHRKLFILYIFNNTFLLKKKNQHESCN